MALPIDRSKWSYWGCVISLEPLVVMSNANSRAPFGIAEALPEVFSGRRSLHFLNPSGALQTFSSTLVDRFLEITRRLPDADFVFMANEEAEYLKLQSMGFAVVLASTYLFMDETVFRPMPEVKKAYDAIYNAAFRKLKNHQLCQEVKSLALVHYRHPVFSYPEDEAHEQDMRVLLAHADILNEKHGSPFRWLSAQEVAEAVNQSYCGLILSDMEGAVRACCEYLLCGVPVVSVPSIGGRMRYLNPKNSRLVERNSGAVAEAVNQLRDLKPDAREIRRDFLNILEFERRNFLTVVNFYAENLLGQKSLLQHFNVFRSANSFVTSDVWAKRLLKS